jgi:hypothetical protein
MECVLIAAGIAGLVLICGLACCNLSFVMRNVRSSLAILAAVGG